MKYYQKNPIIVEAVQFNDDSDSLIELSNLLNAELVVSYEGDPKLILNTWLGKAEVPIGAYVVKGEDQEIFTLTKEQFESKYEEFDQVTYSLGLNIKIVNTKESVIGYGVKINGEWKTVDYQTFRITLPRKEFSTILEGNKFRSIEERTMTGKFVKTTDPELLKFLINETEDPTLSPA